MFARVVACVVAAACLVAAGRFQGISLAIADAGAGIMASTAIASNAAPAPQDQKSSELSALPHLSARDLKGSAHKAPYPIEPFSSATIPWFSGDVFQKWQEVEEQIRSESKILAHCREAMANCPAAAQKFLDIVAAGRAQTGRGRIGVINRAVNLAIKPTSDFEQWGVADHWSSPLETFKTGRGDCEDYAIAKFGALLAAGVTPQDVKLVVVHDKVSDHGHIVTAARVDGHWLLLDNRWLTLVEDSDMHRFAPLFVIDYTGVRTYL